MSSMARLRLRELTEENADLRKRLELEPTDELSWERIGPQELRDRMAVRALLAEWGQPERAIIRLGFDADEIVRTPGMKKRLIARVFETPGVKALLAENLLDIEAQRAQILARQVQLALYGNDESAAKAATLLSKVAGWSPADKPITQTVNLYTLVGAGVGGAAGIASAAQAKAVASETLSSDPLALLSHDPGGPVRIDSGDDAIKAIFEQDE